MRINQIGTTKISPQAILPTEPRFLLWICDDVDLRRAFIVLRVYEDAGSSSEIGFSQGERPVKETAKG